MALLRFRRALAMLAQQALEGWVLSMKSKRALLKSSIAMEAGAAKWRFRGPLKWRGAPQDGSPEQGLVGRPPRNARLHLAAMRAG